MSKKKLLVTGASGKLGRQVVSCLLDDFGIAPTQLILTTRNAESLANLAETGVEIREADFSNPASLEKAFAGADSLLLISVDAIGQRTELHQNAVVAADKTGIKHLTYTSMPSADTSPVVFAFEHVASEKAIADSAIENWTILRNNWYFENLPEFFSGTLQTGTWLTSSGLGRNAQISREDLAYAAATSLVKSIEGKKTLSLNGPESLTTEEMALAIDSELGTAINVIQMSDQALKTQLESFQLPEGLVAMITTMEQHSRGNYSDGTCEDFEQLTGKKPKSFTQWLAENRTSLIEIVNSAA